MNSFKLYGDGIHDDAPAIQEMLDSGATDVFLPPPPFVTRSALL